MLGVLGRSDVADPGLESSVELELPDQLKALRLARRGGVSVSAPSVSTASDGAWSDFSKSSDSSFDSFDSDTLRSELAKNLQEKPDESKHRTEAAPSGKLFLYNASFTSMFLFISTYHSHVLLTTVYKQAQVTAKN